MAKRGRKTSCTPERIAKICKAIEGGETAERAAKIGGISEATFYEWMNSKPEFSEAVKKAKDAYEDWQLHGIMEDAKKSLKVLIQGLEYTESKTEYEPDPENPSVPRIKKQVTITKRIPPSPTAVIFALCNRDPDNWKNRINSELSGKIETESKPNISLANVPDELLAEVIKSINGK